MYRKILSVITIILFCYVSISFILGNRDKSFINKNVAAKSELEKLEDKSIDEVEGVIEEHKVQLANEKQGEDINSGDIENGEENYYKYYENTVFMGDSITEGLAEFGIVNSYNVIANKGDTVIKAMNNMDKLSNINPKNLVLMYGMNDVIFFDDVIYGDGAKAFKEAYIKFVNAIKASLPKTNIYIISPLPVEDNARNTNSRLTNENLNAFRGKAKEVTEETGTTFVDLASTILNKDYLYESDGIHYKIDFYNVLMEYLIDYIN